MKQFLLLLPLLLVGIVMPATSQDLSDFNKRRVAIALMAGSACADKLYADNPEMNEKYTLTLGLIMNQYNITMEHITPEVLELSSVYLDKFVDTENCKRIQGTDQEIEVWTKLVEDRIR